MQKRVFGLDVVRACAISMVVISHCFGMLLPLNKAPWGIGWLAGKMIALTIPFDILGVELFFVLSGFLIGSILIKQFSEQPNFGIRNIKSFWIRRWFRTLPNYYLILILNIVLYSYWKGASAFDWRYFFFLQSMFHQPPHFFGESWSLAIEEWFYFSIPLVVLLCAWCFRNLTKQKVLLRAIIAYIVLFTVMKIVYAIHYTYGQQTAGMFANEQAKGLRKTVLLRLDAIGFGVLMAYCSSYYKEQLTRWRRPLLFIGLIGVCAITGLHYLGTYPGLDLYQYHWAMFASNALLYTFIPLFFSCLLPAAASWQETGRKSLGKTITYISTISYSIYLVHLSLIYEPFFMKLEDDTVLGAIRHCLLYATIVGAAASLLYFLYEKPMTALRENFR